VLKEDAAFDVFTMPSWSDPCPLVVLENMLMENPVVCFSGSGGPPDEVGPDGVVVSGFCPRAMAKEVAALVADPARSRSLGQAGRKRVLERFTTRTQAPKVLAHIERLAAGGHP
jgi:glycosyltransferase involved in cell wall biosynthesis